MRARWNLAPHLAAKLLRSAGERKSTTLDAEVQRYAVDTLHQHLSELAERGVGDGAIVVLDNATGEVLAYVGSGGALSSAAQVDGVIAPRQAGSTLKPFLYALAFDSRLLTAASLVDDSPVAIATERGMYVPQNYDRQFRGMVSVRTALGSSLNVPAVRTLGLVGVDRFHGALRRLGFDTLIEPDEYYGASLALGGADVNLLALTNAYRALANGGVYGPPRFVPRRQASSCPISSPIAARARPASGSRIRWRRASGARQRREPARTCATTGASASRRAIPWGSGSAIFQALPCTTSPASPALRRYGATSSIVCTKPSRRSDRSRRRGWSNRKWRSSRR
jgi:membrane carboxypeptidase/penicillin-binding protein PbpC